MCICVCAIKVWGPGTLAHSGATHRQVHKALLGGGENQVAQTPDVVPQGPLLVRGAHVHHVHAPRQLLVKHFQRREPDAQVLQRGWGKGVSSAGASQGAPG